MHSAYFIYKRYKLPKYALANIELVKQSSEMKIYLIRNSIFKKKLKKIKYQKN